MKESLRAVAICAVVMAGATSGLSQAAREATIEPETKARIILQTPLSAKLNEPGDPIIAVLQEPIYVNGMMVMPQGTKFHGRVTAAKSARRVLKNAQMAIVLDRVAMAWGEEPVAVALTSIKVSQSLVKSPAKEIQACDEMFLQKSLIKVSNDAH